MSGCRSEPPPEEDAELGVDAVSTTTQTASPAASAEPAQGAGNDTQGTSAEHAASTLGTATGRVDGAVLGRPGTVPTDPTAQGELPQEVIQRVIRQHAGRFRSCYEDGLRTDPKLKGTVNVTFVIGKEGNVTSAREASSDMGNEGVSACMVRVFQGMVFPAPKNGVVTVTYPLRFTSG
ncbi:AgmX/PglI C-terminal domain-containing protein [Chondromyces crocatus]|nr:AgmX/PglI C-terminal domain-containing protein [Chondromyces crocatus]